MACVVTGGASLGAIQVGMIQRLVIAHETLLPRHVEPLAGVAA